MLTSTSPQVRTYVTELCCRDYRVLLVGDGFECPPPPAASTATDHKYCKVNKNNAVHQSHLL